MQLWIAEAELTGFVMADQVVSAPGRDVHPALRRVELTPRQERWDVYELRCEIEYDGEGVSPAAQEIWALASDCVERVAARLSVGMWEGLHVRLKGVGLMDSTASKILRLVTCPRESGEITRPPVPIVAGALSGSLDDYVVRAMIWIRKALVDEHPYDKFLGLVVACSLIAGHRFKQGAPRRVRKRSGCGKKDQLKPAERQHLENMCFLLGEDRSLARSIWRLRSKLVHGGLVDNATTRSQVRDLLAHTERLLQKALVKILGEDKVRFPVGPRAEIEFMDYSVEAGTAGEQEHTGTDSA